MVSAMPALIHTITPSFYSFANDIPPENYTYAAIHSPDSYSYITKDTRSH